MEEVIKSLIEVVMGAADADVEVIKLEPGQTIQQVMEQRGFKAVGDACECGEHHTFEKDGRLTGAFTEDPLKDARPNNEFKAKRAKALEGVRRKQAEVLRMYDLLKELEKSIAQKEKDRDIMDLMNEVSLFAQIRAIAGRI